MQHMVHVVHRPISITRFLPGLPLNRTSNKHWPIWIARGRSSEQESACFQARILPVISETKVLVWLEKRSSCHGNRELSILYIGFDIRLAKSFIRSGIFFPSKLCPRSTWCGVWFSDQKLRRARKRKVKASQFAIAINTLTRPQPTHFTFSFTGLSSPEFLMYISGFFCFLFTLYSLAQCNTDQIFICSKTVSIIWKGSVSKTLGQPSPPNQWWGETSSTSSWPSVLNLVF